MRYLVFLFFPLVLNAQTLSGVIDMHLHARPDSEPRSIDVFDLAKMAKERGMRGIVLKNHSESTAAVAYLARKLVPGIEVFGGIALNLTVGGVNPAAVEQMAKLEGGWGRIVWMPTRDAETPATKNRAFVSVSLNGQVRPEVKEVLGMIAKHNLILATGHIVPEDSLLIIREAHDLGVKRIVVTHAYNSMSLPQMKEAAKLGAYLEFVYAQMLGTNRSHDIKDYAAAIRSIGPEHCIISSDMGRPEYPLPPDGMGAFIRTLREQGLTEADIDQIAKKNPAVLLGLPN